ncbi:hypothetical protein HDU67_001695 [Dinochytrium kinnereticum]|nr:hypothetical protein HDU67_001695 [Dinochytrium kinnereticum]
MKFAKVVIAPNLMHSGILSTFNFSSLGLDQYLKFRCQEIEKACDLRFSALKNTGLLSPEDKILLSCTERVWRTLPKSDADCTFFSLPDKGSGHVLLHSSQKELVFSSQCKLPIQTSQDDLIGMQDGLLSLGSRQSSITSTAVSSPLQDSTTLMTNNSNTSHSMWINQVNLQDNSTRNAAVAENVASGILASKKWDSGRTELFGQYWDEPHSTDTPSQAAIEAGRMLEENPASVPVSTPMNLTGTQSAGSTGWEKISENSDKDNWDYASLSSDDSDDFPSEGSVGVSTLWVGNIPEEASEHDLKVYFRSVPVIRIRLSKKRPDKRPCAYVDVREEDMDRALRLSGERLLGARLKVEYDPNRLQKLRKKRHIFNDIKPESPESIAEIERLRLTQSGTDSERWEQWVPGQLRKWSSTPALDIASNVGTAPKKPTALQRTNLGKPSHEIPLNSSSLTAGATSNVSKPQWNGTAIAGRLTSSRSMSSLLGEPSTLNTALPAGWSTHNNPNASWDSPPRKPTSFTSGAEWDRPSESGKVSTWEVRPSSSINVPPNAPKTPSSLGAPPLGVPWTLDTAQQPVPQQQRPILKPTVNLMPTEPASQSTSLISSANWALYGKGSLPSVDENSWIQNGAKPGWNIGRTFAGQPDTSTASFQASWNQRGGVTNEGGGSWSGPAVGVAASRMPNQPPPPLGQNTSQTMMLAGNELDTLNSFAPAWLRGSKDMQPQQMPSPVTSGVQPPNVIRRKGSLPNLPSMGGGKSSWDSSVKPDTSSLWATPSQPADASWSMGRKEGQGIWSEAADTPKQSVGSSRLPGGALNVNITPIGHAWEAAKASELPSPMDVKESKVWGPTGWHPDWRRS